MLPLLKSSLRCRRLLAGFALFITLCCAELEAGEFFELSLKNVPEQDYLRTGSFFKVYHKFREQLLHGHELSSALPCRIYFIKDKKSPLLEFVELKNNTIAVYLPAELEKWRGSAQLRTELAEGLLLCAMGVSPGKGRGLVPAWLAAGMGSWAFASTAQEKIPGALLAPGVRILLDAQKSPSLNSLVSAPPILDNSPVACLYGEACIFLLQAALRTSTLKDNPVPEMLVDCVMRKYSPQAAFYGKMGQSLLKKLAQSGPEPDETRLGKWFEEELRRAVLNGFSPLSAAGAEKEFRRVSVISYTSKKEGVARSCSLEELAERLPEMANADLVLRDLQRDCAWLCGAFPEILRPAFVQIQDLVASSRTEGHERFSSRMKELEKIFYAALGRQAAMERWMKEVEAQNTPPGLRYAPVFQELQRQSSMRPPLFGAIDSNLEELSHRYK